MIDATLDGGGHSLAIKKQFPGVEVLGIEFDPVEVREFIANHPGAPIAVVNDSYINMKAIAAEHKFLPGGIIFDLGVSSWHYQSSNRGFSFQKDEPLDMRFNPEQQKITAADILNTWDEKELERIFKEYGEEQFAELIATQIVRQRREKPILTTQELAKLIEDAVPEWYKHRKINPATKTFQALRIAVNNELETIRSGLEAAIEVLQPLGRLVVISFHGLEDKVVRAVFKEAVTAGKLVWVTKDTIKPTWNEIQNNKRARSAKMKIAQKV